jgi:dGTP triphosphohydrolase
MIRELADMLESWLKEAAMEVSELKRLPALLDQIRRFAGKDREALRLAVDDDQSRLRRAVVDYIASLTETQAIELYSRLSGHSSRSALEGWLRT